MDEQHFSFQNRLRSFLYAFRGIKHTFKTQHNLCIHCFAAITVIIISAILDITLTEWCLIIFACGLVICAEIFNSAIEKLTDLVSPERNEAAGYVKDIAAGAVLVAAIVAVIIGAIIILNNVKICF